MTDKEDLGRGQELPDSPPYPFPPVPPAPSLPRPGSRSSALRGSLWAGVAGLSFVPARLLQPRSSAAGGAAARCPVHQHHLGAIRVAGVSPRKRGERSASLGESPRTSGTWPPQP